jgi:peptidoglycan/LPS O-acetylase OafA/YrhL
VVLAHSLVPQSAPKAIKDGLAVFKRGGFAGVDLFFVLSGFLVSSLLFTEYQRYRTLKPGRFLIRRGLKIYPPFYLMLALTIVYGIRGWWPVTVKQFFVEVFFLQNYLPLVWGHTWSLAIEEHFYLMLTAGLFFLATRARQTDLGGKPAFRALVPAFFFVAAFCEIARAITYWLLVRNGRPVWLMATHLRIDELLFGVLLSYLWAFDNERVRNFVARHRRILAIGVSLSVTSFFVGWTPTVMVAIGFVTLYLTFGALLLVVLLRDIRHSMPALFFGRIGVASYSIYLWHIPWRVAVDHITGWMHVPQDAWTVPLGLYLVGSVIVGITAAALIELPVLRLRDRLLPSRSEASAPVPPTIRVTDEEAASSPLLPELPKAVASG